MELTDINESAKSSQEGGIGQPKKKKKKKGGIGWFPIMSRWNQIPEP